MYAQIEKELLAIVFGAETFNQDTYGRKVTVKSVYPARFMKLDFA